MNPNAYLIGKKVYLRPLELTDAPAITPWFNNPEVRRTLDSYRPMTVSAEQAYLSQIYQSPTDLVLGIVVSESDRLIGASGLHGMNFKDRSTLFGISIGEPSEWGKGYGTEATALMAQHAFDTLNLHRIELRVREKNERAIRAYARVGFQREGLLRQDHFLEGRYGNTILMSLLRDDWNALHPRSH